MIAQDNTIDDGPALPLLPVDAVTNMDQISMTIFRRAHARWIATCTLRRSGHDIHHWSVARSLRGPGPNWYDPRDNEMP